MNTNKFQTLRFKLSIIIILFALVPVLILSIFFINRMESSIISEQKKSVEKQLTLVSDSINLFFNDMENSLRGTRHEWAVCLKSVNILC